MKCRYMIVRLTKDTVLFDERFVNYRCNIAEYAHHLRYSGYSFYILSSEYVMEFVHHRYVSLFSFHCRTIRERNYQQDNVANIMDACDDFMKKVIIKKGSSELITKNCNNIGANNYHSILDYFHVCLSSPSFIKIYPILCFVKILSFFDQGEF